MTGADNPGGDFFPEIGRHVLIKRRQLEAYLDNIGALCVVTRGPPCDIVRLSWRVSFSERNCRMSEKRRDSRSRILHNGEMQLVKVIILLKDVKHFKRIRKTNE